MPLPFTRFEGELALRRREPARDRELDPDGPLVSLALERKARPRRQPSQTSPLQLDLEYTAQPELQAPLAAAGITLAPDGKGEAPDHRHAERARKFARQPQEGPPAMSADTLQKVFKTLSDPTRVRILALLEREELAVQELMDVLGMAQSRVSRHLAILRDAGLVQDRRDGTYVFYRFVAPADGRLAARPGRWSRATLASDPTQRARPRRALAGDGGARRAHAQLLRLGRARVGRAAQGLQRRRAARARDRPGW